MELSKLIYVGYLCAGSLMFIAVILILHFVWHTLLDNRTDKRLQILKDQFFDLVEDFENAKHAGDKAFIKLKEVEIALDGICNSINATDQSVIDLTKRVDQHKQIINENFKEVNRREQLLENRDNQLLAICETHRIEINKLCRKKSEAKRSRS